MITGKKEKNVFESSKNKIKIETKGATDLQVKQDSLDREDLNVSCILMFTELISSSHLNIPEYASEASLSYPSIQKKETYLEAGLCREKKQVLLLHWFVLHGMKEWDIEWDKEEVAKKKKVYRIKFILCRILCRSHC